MNIRYTTKYNIICVISLIGLSSCASNKAAYEHYDACSKTNLSFREMVSCGKTRRTEYCTKADNCGADGDAIVQYADTLVQAVDRKEMTESDAKLRWLEYRNGRADALNNAQQAEASRAAAAAASINAVNAANRPRTCYTNGGVTNCY